MNHKEFLKLKQLDRIEYFLLQEKIDEDWNFPFFSVIVQYFYFLFSCIVIGLLYYIAFDKDTYLFYKLMIIMSIVLKPYVIIAMILYIIYMFVNIFKSRKLEKRFLKKEK